jgi:hypothetical protein
MDAAAEQTVFHHRLDTRATVQAPAWAAVGGFFQTLAIMWALASCRMPGSSRVIRLRPLRGGALRTAAQYATVGVAAALLGVAITLGPKVLGIGPGLIQALFLLATLSVGVAACARLVRAIRAGAGPERLASMLVALTLLVAVGVPGAQELAGQKGSITADLGFPSADLHQDIARAYLVFLLALAALVAGETLVLTLPRPRTPSSHWLGRAGGDHLRGTYVVLLMLGVVGEMASPGGDLAARGTITGQGITDVLHLSFPTAIAIGILSRHWGSRSLAVVDILLTTYLLSGGTRTPFLIVGSAYLLRLLLSASQSRNAGWRLLVGGIVFVYIAAILVGGLSTWRGQRTAGHEASLVASLAGAARQPFAATGGGADSLDGLILAMKTDRTAVGAHWYDPSKAVLGFVPRKYWQGKPMWLSSTVTHQYTNFGSLAGIFLSGPGYAYVVFGGLLGMMLCYLGIGAAAQLALRQLAISSVGCLLLTYFLVRFTFGGDAFDAFNVLTLLALVLLARGIAALAAVVLRRPRVPRPLPTGVAQASAD